jgi:hypothetical protein
LALYFRKMPDIPTEPTHEEREKAFIRAIRWPVYAIVLAALSYFGLKDPLVMAALFAIYAPISFLFTLAASGTFWSVVIIYAAFVISGEVRRRRARSLRLPARPFAQRPFSRPISWLAGARSPVRHGLRLLVGPLKVTLALVYVLAALVVVALLFFCLPTALGGAQNYLLGGQGPFDFTLLLFATVLFGFLGPRRLRRSLYHYPYLWGRMVWRRTRYTFDRLDAVLAAP